MFRIPDQDTFNGFLLRAEKSYSDFSSACCECKSYKDGTEEYISDLFKAFQANYNVVIRLEFLMDDFRCVYNHNSIKRFDLLKRCKQQSVLVYQRWKDMWKGCEYEGFVDDLPF